MGENFSLSPEIVRLRALKIDHHGDVPPDREDKKLEILKNLRSIKEDYKSGIPNEIKHSTDEDPKWKVRKAWFQVVVFCLAGILKMYVEDVRGGRSNNNRRTCK